MFGSIMGSSGYSTGQTFGGVLGLLNIVKMAEGGSFITNGPTPFLAGEAGREMVNVTPLGKEGQGGGGPPIIVNNYTENNYIETTDLETYERKYVPKVIGAMGKTKYRDQMKNIVRRNG